MLKRIAIVVALLGAAYLAHFSFAKTTPMKAKDDFTRSIEKLYLISVAEYENKVENRQVIQGVWGDQANFSVSMPIPQFTNRMEDLGYECSKLGGFDRIGCHKYERRECHPYIFFLCGRYYVGYTFIIFGETLTFMHGSSSRRS